MLDAMLSTTTSTANGSIDTMLLSIGIALITGLVISVLYMKTNSHSYSQSLAITLVFMPAVISTIILLVGENIAAAFSLAGIFTIIRFRSAPGSAKDILLILFGVGAGLAYGVQLYLYGVLFTAAMVVAQYLLFVFKFGEGRREKLQLKITAPDSANNEEMFAKVLSEHTSSFRLERIGTRDLGSVYELVYFIELTRDQERKALIDELRRHNSNMNISLGNRETINAF
ncbi:MAG TPA: DUF4956 domain-containing protein [Candidatus Saccharibacteria bacterium]|nr:DUF4956 domain-containing protein [Candidatus Saccharibacteria bacterium]